MSCIRAVINILNKVHFDRGRADVNTYNYHPQLRVLLASIGVFFGNYATNRLRWILPITSMAITIGGLILEVTAMWHGIMVQDYGFATECFAYCTAWGTSVMLYISVFKNADGILELAEDMNKNFIEIYALGARYRAVFMRTQFKIWKFSIAWCSFLSILLTFYVTAPAFKLIYWSLTGQREEHVDRPLPIVMWLPLPYNETPYYEIFYFIHFSLVFNCTQTYCVYISVMLHVLLHYYALMDMIILDFEVIFDGLNESVALLPPNDRRYIHAKTTLTARMKRIVTWHQSIFKVVNAVSSIFGPPLVYQVMASPIGLCVISSEIAHKLDQGEADLIFILLLAGCLIQIWVPCHLGTMIGEKALDVGDACWNCGWEKTSLTRLIRQDIIFFILRCQSPLTIKFVGLPKLDLETFSLIVTRAYTFFNMLRQYSAKDN